jgi:hypothetical protein
MLISQYKVAPCQTIIQLNTFEVCTDVNGKSHKLQSYSRIKYPVVLQATLIIGIQDNEPFTTRAPLHYAVYFQRSLIVSTVY